MTALALAVLAVTGSALAQPEKVTVGSVEVRFGGDSLVWGKFRGLDGSRLPALRELKLRVDKDLEIDVEGRPDVESVPTCTSGRRPRRTIAEVRKACRPAIVGTGALEARVRFPEREPVDVKSELLAINGGVKGSIAVIYLHAFFSAPVTGEIVTTMEVKKVRRGRFGTEMVASIPKIAGGSGSVTHFELDLDKDLLHETCPDEHLSRHYTAVFSDGTKASARLTEPCTSKG
jgi:hypothetical protein